MAKEYKCVCGRTFTNSQGLNGHKSHCEVHLKQTGKFESRKQAKAIGAAKANAVQHQRAQEKQQQKLKSWLASEPKCETCGKTMTEFYGSGRFCCRSCANKRDLTEATKLKISNGLNDFYDNGIYHTKYRKPANTLSRPLKTVIDDYNKQPNQCSVCGKVLDYKNRNKKTCSPECLHVAFVNAGIKAAQKVGKRSQNEITFCKKCEEYFGTDNVLHNEPIFNGWDADIIIPEYKLAILWNGPWHYRKVTKSHSLEQVQTRDKIKYDQIKLCGFIPYIIKDNSKFNLNKVNSEFNKLIEYIRNL